MESCDAASGCSEGSRPEPSGKAGRRLVRWPQRAAETITIPMEGEHFTRRLSLKVPSHGFEVKETIRRSLGAIEMVAAVKRSDS